MQQSCKPVVYCNKKTQKQLLDLFFGWILWSENCTTALNRILDQGFFQAIGCGNEF